MLKYDLVREDFGFHGGDVSILEGLQTWVATGANQRLQRSDPTKGAYMRMDKHNQKRMFQDHFWNGSFC